MTKKMKTGIKFVALNTVRGVVKVATAMTGVVVFIGIESSKAPRIVKWFFELPAAFVLGMGLSTFDGLCDDAEERRKDPAVSE